MSEEMQTDTPQPAAPEPEQAAMPEPPPPDVADAIGAMEDEGAPAIDPAVVAAVAVPPPAPSGERRADRPPREPRTDNRPNRPQVQPNPADRAKTGENLRRAPDQRADRPRDAAPRGPDRDRRPEIRRPEGPAEIEYDKLIADSLYMDNQAHLLVARLRDLDAGTRSQLRRLYGAVRRACRAAEADRQHQFVMLRARLAYTIARHGLRSLDPLERLLLQVTRRNETRGYDRFRDLFEAIIAYNE